MTVDMRASRKREGTRITTPNDQVERRAALTLAEKKT
jgi:hypothetical protein